MVVLIDYAVISPAVLHSLLNAALDCLCRWSEVSEDVFEFEVIECEDLAKAERILARYV